MSDSDGIFSFLFPNFFNYFLDWKEKEEEKEKPPPPPKGVGGVGEWGSVFLFPRNAWGSIW